MAKKQLLKEDINKIKKLHKEGKSFMEIAFETRISLWTVKYHLDEKYRESIKRNNIKRNRKIAKKKKQE